ncbi:MAG TPA: PAS domain S-box protein [Aggregatilineales bacterium]|nr:PAS domain S-box protein [Aggregatilineales bacterium]
MQTLSGTSAEQIAEWQKNELEQFFALSRDYMAISGKNGYFKRINPAFVRAFGYSAEELLGRPLTDFIHPDDRPMTLERMAVLQSSTLPIPASGPKLEIRIICKDGSIKWVEWASTPAPEQELLYSVGRDITEQRKLLDRLFESEDRYRSIVETTSEGIFILDTTGKSEWVNRRMTEMLGFSAEEIVGHSAMDYIKPELRESTLAKIRSRAQGVEETYELCFIHKNGSEVWTINNATPLRDRDGKHVGSFGVFTDITERKRTEAHIQTQNEALVRANRELAVARRNAEEASRIKSEFLSTMSHELRTPLNAIIGYTEIQLAGMTGDLTDEQRDYQTRALVNAENLLTLINGLLDIAKIESGRLELTKKPFAIHDLVQEIAYQTKGLAEDKGLSLAIAVDNQMPPTVVGDYVRLKQMIVNLVSNGIKFTDTGSVTVNVSGQIPTSWTIDVTDTGVGIPTHAQEYIFDEFRQIDATSQRKHGGTGLGLAIVRRLTNMMGGSVRVKSKIGEGSTFTITLPLITEFADMSQ